MLGNIISTILCLLCEYDIYYIMLIRRKIVCQ